MAATSTPLINSVVKQLQADYADIAFRYGSEFQWSPTSRTITHPNIKSYEDLFQLLHEISHAQLSHSAYQSDIRLIDMERQAWQYAIDQIAPKYQLSLTEEDDVVQSALDSYRQWLHARSSCPSCSAVGQEVGKNHYRCLSCHQKWRVNEARTCGLKRYKT